MDPRDPFSLISGSSQGIESLLRLLAPPQSTPFFSPHPRDVGENKTMNQWDPVFLEPKAGQDAWWAGRLQGQGWGYGRNWVSLPPPKESGSRQGSWPWCWAWNQSGIGLG